MREGESGDNLVSPPSRVTALAMASTPSAKRMMLCTPFLSEGYRASSSLNN